MNVPASGPDRRRAIYDDAMEVIRRRFAEDLELDTVGREVAASRRQLQRAFAEAGTTFRRTLFELRMARAATLLRSRPELPVRDVARAVGYTQAAQFAKAFRRRYGVPPAGWRERGSDTQPVAVRLAEWSSRWRPESRPDGSDGRSSPRSRASR